MDDGELARCGFTVGFKVPQSVVYRHSAVAVLQLKVQLSKASPTALFELLSWKHWKTGPLLGERVCGSMNTQSDAAEKKAMCAQHNLYLKIPGQMALWAGGCCPVFFCSYFPFVL